MRRKLALLALSLAAIVTSGGCTLFAPRPLPPQRLPHVIIVGIEGLQPADIDAARTPHLYLMQQDGAYAWEPRAANPDTPSSVYEEALTGSTGRTIFDLCRAAGLKSVAIVRSTELDRLDPDAVLPAGPRVNTPLSAGSYAASRFLRERPSCLFVQLGIGGDAVKDCDDALGFILAAVTRAGVADRTTVIVLSARPVAWMIRGPGTLRGHQLSGPVSVAGTFDTAATLLNLSAPEARARLVTGAFYAWSRQQPSKGERVIPRGSVRGRVTRPDGRPLPRASVLLVKDEPLDGIFEHWADTSPTGEFRFDNLPAGNYDYVFVFDNLPARLRTSLLVRRNFEIKPDTSTELALTWQRIQGPDPAAPALPPSKTAPAFLEAKELKTLADACRHGLPIWPGPAAADPPPLAADVLSGTRARTTLIREWLLGASARLQAALSEPALAAETVTLLTDLAAAYDLNQPSGVLTATEDQEVRTTLRHGAQLSLRSEADLREPVPACVAIAVAAGALGQPGDWLERADKMYETHFADLSRDAERAPAAIDHDRLCYLLEYAMVNRAAGCGNYVNRKLQRVVSLAADTLAPDQRRVLAEVRTAPPALGLGFLGFAKAAFADSPFGGEMQSLWTACGSPFWAPRGGNSLLGIIQTAAGMPTPRPLKPLQSKQLTDTSAVLTRGWGTADEWFAQVDGRTLALHIRGTKLATFRTVSPDGLDAVPARIERFITSPAYDYVLLSGTVSPRDKEGLVAYRHILFNKLTGYIVTFDQTPAICPDSLVTIEAPGGLGQDGNLIGAGGLKAKLLLLSANVSQTSEKGATLAAAPLSVIVIYPPPAGAPAHEPTLRQWDVTSTSLAPKDVTEGANIALTTDRGTEFIRLARTPANVADNVDDNLLEGTVGLIRRGTQSVDLILIDARWAQTGDLFFRLDRGDGYATVYRTGRAEGWSQGRSRAAIVLLGENAPQKPALTIDARPAWLRMKGDRAEFSLSSGAHVFVIK